MAMLFGLAVAATPALGESAASHPDPDKLAADVVRALDLQRDLIRDRSQDSRFKLDLPNEALWLAALLSLALLLYAFRDMIPVWGRRRADDWLSAGAGAGAGQNSRTAEQKAEEADALARDGRFAEAMHALLLQSVMEIRSRLDARIADSLTSREILRRVRLTAEGAAALREIILSVEWTYFGEHPADASDYGRCRQHFEALGRALASVTA
ncbi:MAG TPA: DUF4129 domain-containing protein [Alphaproteobacteria bacterium]|nr:DUF4129 domain-containing protein [Alphaproteobacteria bacterium]